MRDEHETNLDKLLYGMLTNEPSVLTCCKLGHASGTLQELYQQWWERADITGGFVANPLLVLCGLPVSVAFETFGSECLEISKFNCELLKSSLNSPKILLPRGRQHHFQTNINSLDAFPLHQLNIPYANNCQISRMYLASCHRVCVALLLLSSINEQMQILLHQ